MDKISFIHSRDRQGLVKNSRTETLFYELYYELAAYSVSDAIYIRKELTKELTEQVSSKTWRMNFESFIENEPNSFILTTEADETINENGKDKLLYDYKFGNETKINL